MQIYLTAEKVLANLNSSRATPAAPRANLHGLTTAAEHLLDLLPGEEAEGSLVALPKATLQSLTRVPVMA